MKSYLMKFSKYRGQVDTKSSQNGKIILSKKDVVCHEYPLNDKILKSDGSTRRRRVIDGGGGELATNMEWQHIFAGGAGSGGGVNTGVGPGDAHSPGAASSPSNDSTSPIVAGSPPGTTGTQVQPTPTSSLVEYSMPERNFWQGKLISIQLSIFFSHFQFYLFI